MFDSQSFEKGFPLHNTTFRWESCHKAWFFMLIFSFVLIPSLSNVTCIPWNILNCSQISAWCCRAPSRQVNLERNLKVGGGCREAFGIALNWSWMCCQGMKGMCSPGRGSHTVLVHRELWKSLQAAAAHLMMLWSEQQRGIGKMWKEWLAVSLPSSTEAPLCGSLGMCVAAHSRTAYKTDKENPTPS